MARRRRRPKSRSSKPRRQNGSCIKAAGRARSRTGLAIADLPYAAGAGGIGDTGAAAVAIVHLGIEAVAFLLEACHQRSVERTAARQLDAHRIDEAAVDQDFVVDVGAGRLSSRADEADHLALANPFADL